MHYFGRLDLIAKVVLAILILLLIFGAGWFTYCFLWIQHPLNPDFNAYRLPYGVGNWCYNIVLLVLFLIDVCSIYYLCHIDNR